MPKKQSRRKSRGLLTRSLLIFIKSLIFLGYLIMYPFEQAAIVSKNLLRYLYFKSKKIIYYFRTKDYVTIKANLAKYLTNLKAFFVAIVSTYKQKKKSGRFKNRSVEKSKNLKVKNKRVLKNSKSGTKPKRKVPFFRGCFLFFSGILFALLFILVPLFGYFWYKELPQPDLLELQTQNGTTKILDRKGRLLYEIYIDKKYDPIPLSKVPDHVIDATIAIEDDQFYYHPGFDMRAILRAMRSVVLEEEVQGGSTITQQLIKNVLLSPERTYERKLKELFLSVLVEREYTKNQILELYLNNIPYGGTAYGVQSASQKYFAKDVWDLDLAEASLLAGLPSAPSAYSPLQGNLDLAKVRQKQVLDRMVSLGYISSQEGIDAYDKKLKFAPQIEYIRAPHFVNYVRDELYKTYGPRTVDLGGLTVTTTLDLDVHDMVQEVVSEEVSKGQALNFSNGAAVVIDSRTGEILAYVGSVNYFENDEGNYDVARAFRQPGSSIKPVTYALALEKGYTATSIIDDSPITYQFDGQKYTPKNYDGKYHGKVTLRQALANSYNIPAVKMVNAVGVDNMVQLGKDMGLTYWNVGDGSYGMSVTLGGKEVRLLDLTNLYATFARYGKYISTTPFVSVKDRYGFEMYSPLLRAEKQVIAPSTAYIITSILSDNAARASAFGPRSQLYIPNKTIAVKTGTTNDIRDNLTLGYTPTYTVGVWVGNNDNEKMNQSLASGLTGAAPIWNRIFTNILEGKNDEPFIAPEGIIIKRDDSCGAVDFFDSSKKVPDSLCVKRTNNEKDNKKDD